MISLKHIDTGATLRRQAEKVAKGRAKAKAQNEAAAATFEIGQHVRTRMGQEGRIVAVEGGKISIEIAGSVRVFAASFVFAI